MNKERLEELQAKENEQDYLFLEERFRLAMKVNDGEPIGADDFRNYFGSFLRLRLASQKVSSVIFRSNPNSAKIEGLLALLAEGSPIDFRNPKLQEMLETRLRGVRDQLEEIGETPELTHATAIAQLFGAQVQPGSLKDRLHDLSRDIAFIAPILPFEIRGLEMFRQVSAI